MAIWSQVEFSWMVVVVLLRLLLVAPASGWDRPGEPGLQGRPARTTARRQHVRRAVYWITTSIKKRCRFLGDIFRKFSVKLCAEFREMLTKKANN